MPAKTPAGVSDDVSKADKQIMRDHIAPACSALAHCASCDLILRKGDEDEWKASTGCGSIERKPFPRCQLADVLQDIAIWADQIGMSAKQRGKMMGNSTEINAAILHR